LLSCEGILLETEKPFLLIKTRAVIITKTATQGIIIAISYSLFYML